MKFKLPELLYALLVLFCPEIVSAQTSAAGSDVRRASVSDLVEELYSGSGAGLIWCCDSCAGKRAAMEQVLMDAASYGLPANNYRPVHPPSGAPNPEPTPKNADRRLSRAAISFCRDLQQGHEIGRWISYNGLPESLAKKSAASIPEGLKRVVDSAGLAHFISSLEPQDAEYGAMKEALRTDSADAICNLQLRTSINFHRWIRHFGLDSFIVINIPSATLRYYKADTVALEMRAVLGTTYNRTPRFAAFCKEVTLYPYWNMPRSILMKEWIASFKKTPGLIDFLSMEVIDAKGRVVPTASIDWKSVSSSNFPYRIREKPGCFNPMGVIKFSLTSPYDVYLHDTNFKGAFLSKSRFYSHGCIRIEEPIALADAILVDKVDAGFLKACFNNQKPQVIKIEHPVPVFVVYMCAEGDATGVVRYYHDTYGLLK